MVEEIDKIISSLDNNKKIFEALAKIMTDSNENTVGGSLVVEIADIFKEMTFLKCSLYDPDVAANIPNKQNLENSLEQCFESLFALMDVDDSNGGSLGFFISQYVKGGFTFNIGMVGLTESKFQIIIRDGNLVQIPSLFPISKETGKPIEYEY